MANPNGLSDREYIKAIAEKLGCRPSRILDDLQKIEKRLTKAEKNIQLLQSWLDMEESRVDHMGEE